MNIENKNGTAFKSVGEQTWQDPERGNMFYAALCLLGFLMFSLGLIRLFVVPRSRVKFIAGIWIR